MRFDARAHSYHANAAPQRWFAAQVAEFIGGKPGQAVLELGAGTGALTRHLCDRGLRVRATDISGRMIDQGRAAVPEAEWFQLDAFHERLPVTDLVVSSGLIQWAATPEKTLRRWCGAVARGGRMVHGFPVEPSLPEWRRFVPEGPIDWRTPQQWLEIFCASGLQSIRSETWTYTLKARSALQILRVLHSSGVTGQVRLNAGQLRRALRRYNEAFDRDNVPATWTWMAIEAVPA